MSKNGAKLSISLIFLAGVVASLFFFYYELKSLGFHTRDFAFYLQFPSKLFDPDLTNRYSLNPEGHNLLKLVGTESVDSFHQAVHLEPIKYVHAVIYRLSGTPLSLFLITAIIQLAPLLYLARVYPQEDAADRRFVVVVSILYAIYPSTVQAVLYDLRPFALLAPLFLLSMLSVYLRRPRWETLVFFNLIFFAREEALILGFIVILFSLATASGDRERRDRTIGLIASWVSWFLITIAYFVWTGYAFKATISWFTILFALLLAGLCLVAYRIIWPRIREARKIPQAAWQIGVYSLILVPLSYQFLQEHARSVVYTPMNGLKQVFVSLVISPRYNLYFTTVLFLAILLWGVVDSIRIRKSILDGMIIASIISIPAQAVLLKSGLSDNGYADVMIVHELRGLTDKYSTYILADYSTHQAFYDYENVYVYNRLPWFLVEGDGRFYPEPQSVSALTNLLRNDIEYIVVSQESVADINELLVLSSIDASRQVTENGTYKIIELR